MLAILVASLTITLLVAIISFQGIFAGVGVTLVSFFAALLFKFALPSFINKHPSARAVSWGLFYGSTVALVGTLAIAAWFIFNFGQ